MTHRCMTRRMLAGSARGQSLVLVALMMLGMLGMLGLVLDGGAAFMTRRNGQDAADAATFAGVRTLATRADDSATSEQKVWNAILTYSQANGVSSATDLHATFIDGTGQDIRQIDPAVFVGIPTSPIATGVRVTATLRFEPYFISLFIGKDPIPLQAVAAAQSGQPVAGSKLKPMTLRLPLDCINPGDPGCFKPCVPGDCTEYVLFGDALNGGNFQWTNYSSPCTTNTGELVDYLRLNIFGGTVIADPGHLHMTPQAAPYWVCGDTGKSVAAQVTQALDWWLAKPEADRHWIIPVFDGDPIASGSNTMYHVRMFADFVPTVYDFGGGKVNIAYDRVGPALDPKDPCNTSGAKQCLMGKFFKAATSLEILPGSCTTGGIDICGIGLSQ